MSLWVAKRSPRIGCAGIFLFAALLWGVGCSPRQDADDELPTLRLKTSRFRGYDPALAVDQATSVAVGRIYEGLLQYS